MTKKLISIFVAVLMVLSIIPAAAFASDGTRLPATEKLSSPATEKSIELWDFEEDPAETGWTFDDADGDGYNWEWLESATYATSGTHSIMSASYYNYSALTPDNWAISPMFAVPEDGAVVTFQVRNYMGSWPETFGVFVIPEGGTPIAIAENQTASGANWVELSFDITEACGQNASIAIRHYNCSDMYRFYIDDVVIDSMPDPNVIYEADVSGFPSRVYGGTTAGELSEALYVADDADYSLVNAYVVKTENGAVLDSADELEVGETYAIIGEIAAADGKSFDENVVLTANEGGMETDPDYTLIPSYTENAFIAVSYECTEEPAVGFYFETDPAEDGWVFVDSDGDGYLWYWLAYGVNYDNVDNMAYEGVGHLTSASYYGGVLTPDNWAISPEFEVPAVDAMVSMYIGAQDPGYAAEHFAVYVGNGEDVDSYTMISEEIECEGIYTYFEFDLSEYAGETVSIAVRHFNCTDMFRLNLDQVEVFGSDEEPEPDPIVIDTIEIEGFVEPVWGANPFYGVTVPADAPYTLDYTDWNWNTGDVTYGMSPSDVFDDEEYTYYQYFEIVPAEGYVFADEVTVTINGDAAFVDFSGWDEAFGYFYVFTIDFSVEEPEPILIDTVEVIGFDLPVFGGNPDFDVTVPEGAPYTLSRVAWYGFVDGELDADYVLIADTYYVVFEFEPIEGYEFNTVAETTMLINGSSELVMSIYCFSGPDAFHMETVNLIVEEPEAGIIGDVDLNGEVTTADALLALRYVMGLVELDEEQLAQADVDGDGEITMIDCLLIQRYAMGVIESFPVENP